jgi:hypothetical protein
MKSQLISATLALPLALAALSSYAPAQQFTAEQLAERAIERRAVEAVIWGIPAVNYERMLQAASASGAKLNQVGRSATSKR